jgi:hypothetical protein
MFGGCTGAVTGGGDGVWLACIFWTGGVTACCEKEASSVLPLGSGEGQNLRLCPGAILSFEVVSAPPGFDGRPGIFKAGRLKAAALIRPLPISEGSPPVGLPLASVRFGYVALPILLVLGVEVLKVVNPKQARTGWLGKKNWKET